MAGILTDGVPNYAMFSGSETLPIDTHRAIGMNPQSAAPSIQQLATFMDFLTNKADITTVAGTRYYSSLILGNADQLTGIAVLVGGTGGTDKFIVELHDSTGVLVATSALAGVTAGTAGTYQQIPFTAAYSAAAGTYYLAVQSNGTTAKVSAYNAPSMPITTGSAAGTFGTSAAITAPTTYTAGVGPVAVIY